MNILNISDLHLRGLDFDLTIAKLAELLRGPEDLVVLCGDVFHKARVGDAAISTQAAIKRLSEALSVAKPVIILEGNHDQFGTAGSGLDLINLPNVVKVQDAVMGFCFEDVQIACIPWIRSTATKDYKQKVLDELDAISAKKEHRIVFGHLNILDANMNAITKVSSDDYFVFTIDELVSTTFAPTGGVFGHLHQRQQLGPNWYYAGAFRQLGFGESDNPSGCVSVCLRSGVDPEFSFNDLDFPQYISTTEEEWLAHQDLYHNYRFRTAVPQRYHNYKNVKPLGLLGEEVEVEQDNLYSNSLDILALVNKYCRDAKVEMPSSDYVQEELKKLALTVQRSQTGIDRVNWVHLSKIGPDPDTLIHEDRYVQFGPNINAIVGANGKGKSMILESIYAALYSKYMVRGHFKNYLQGSIALNCDSQGKPYSITRTRKGKDIINEVNGSSTKLVEEFNSMITPVFGDAELFGRVVFMDQDHKKDLVSAEDTERIELLSKLLSLDFFEELRKDYAKELKKVEEAWKNYALYTEELAAAQSDLGFVEAQLNLLPCDFSEIETLEAVLDRYDTNLDLVKRRDIYLNYKRELEEVEFDLGDLDQAKALEERKSKVKALNLKLQELERNQQDLSEVGCRNNPLPCVFLRKNNQERIDELREEIALLTLSKKEHETVDLFYRYLALKDKVAKRWDSSFEEIEDVDAGFNYALVEAQRNQLKAQKAQYAGLQKQLATTEARVQKYENLLAGLDASKERMEDLKFLVEICDKKSLPLYIMDSMVPELQKALDEIYEASESNIRVVLSTTKKQTLDSFQIMVQKDLGKPYPAKLTSGGERALVRLFFKMGLALYLNRFFGNYKILIMDEPEGGLDAANIELVLGILRKFKYQFNQVIISTHNPYIMQLADKLINLNESYYG